MKIEINEDLQNRLQAYLKETSFKTIEELVEFILAEHLDQNKTDRGNDSDKEILQERLKNLGYL